MPKVKPVNELDVLLPESDIVVNGEKIIIRPFPFSQLPKVIDLLSKMGGGIYSLLSDGGLNFTNTGNVVINQNLLERIGPVLDEHFCDVLELMAIYTGKEASFYIDEANGFTGEDGILIIAEIIERNYRFFTKRLSPILGKIEAKRK